jgi:hypothetical protein
LRMHGCKENIRDINMSARQEQEPKKFAGGNFQRLVLAAYVASRETAKAIAARHGIDVRRLRSWVDAAGYPRRPRGRQPRLEPTAQQKAILGRFGSVPLVQLAREVGESRQYISSLAARWPGWLSRNQSTPVHSARPAEMPPPPRRRPANEVANSLRAT